MKQALSDTELVSLVDAILAETGRRVSSQTAVRWSVDGRCGIRLRRQRLGGRWFCNRLWVREFIAATSELAEQKLNRSSAETIIAGQADARQLEIDRAAQLLRAKVGA